MVENKHERRLSASPAAVGRLIDGLAGAGDPLWPTERWPAMRFDRPLGVGARGGHGPIRYRVESYTPGETIRFRFEAPAGFHGYHEYVAIRQAACSTVLRHSLVMRTTGRARLTWPLLFRPLHDALIEDSLDNASRSLGLMIAAPNAWSWRVRLLRAIARRRSLARRQSSPRTTTHRRISRPRSTDVEPVR